MAEINRYVLVEIDGTEQDFEFTTMQEAITEADSEQAVIERVYEYADSSLVWTPDGSNSWPPNNPTRTK